MCTVIDKRVAVKSTLLVLLLMMATANQAALISRIVSPRREDMSALLEELGLAGLPPREQIFQDIEAKLLLPPTGFPEHLLSTYQMCDMDSYKGIDQLTGEPVLGTAIFTYQASSVWNRRLRQHQYHLYVQASRVEL